MDRDVPEDFEPQVPIDDESIPLHIRRDECIRMLEWALKLSRQRGLKMVDFEADYYNAKAEAVFSMKDDGIPATLIAQAVKGLPTVSGELRQFHAAEVEYKNAQEAVNVYKLKLRSLESEIEREWEQAKRM